MRDLETELNKLLKSALILFISLGVFSLIYGIYKTSKTAKTVERQTKYIHKINEAQSAAFVLVWKEFASSMPDKKIIFKGKKSQEADTLNKRGYVGPPLSPSYYYTAYGLKSDDLEQRINSETSIKFNTQSAFNFLDEGIILFSMVKKSTDFLEPFDILVSAPFNNSSANVKYFGINWLSNDTLSDDVEVLFYNSPKDFAISISAPQDELILYRTSAQKTPEALYEDVIKKSDSYKGSNIFSKPDSLTIPFITTPDLISHNDLLSNEIEGMDKIKISSIVDSFMFNLTNSGINTEKYVKKEEKSINSSDFDNYKKGKEFNFNKNFVIFLLEKGAKEPYYTLFVDNSNILINDL